MRSIVRGREASEKKLCFEKENRGRMPGIEDKNDTEDDEMEQDTPESDKSDDEEDSESGSGSEEDESSGV